MASINFAAGTHGADCGHIRERTDRKLTRFMECHAEPRPTHLPAAEEPREAEVPDAYKARRYLMLAYAFPDISDYELTVGYKTNGAFRAGWDMARTTARDIGLDTGSAPPGVTKP